MNCFYFMYLNKPTSTMALSPYHLKVEQIHSTIFSEQCHASAGCKDDTLSLLGMLNCAIDMDHFDQKTYSYYRGLIDKWISTHSGRTFVTVGTTVDVLQDRRFSKNSSLSEMIFALIPAFKKEIYDRFGFSPKETSREQAFSKADVSWHHGRSSTCPIPLKKLRETSFSRTPTTGGLDFSRVTRS